METCNIVYNSLPEAILDNLEKENVRFVVNGKVYSTAKVTRQWALALCPGLYYELCDEEPEHDEIEVEEE